MLILFPDLATQVIACSAPNKIRRFINQPESGLATETLFVTHWGNTGQKVVMVHGSAQGSDVGGDRHFSRQQKLSEKFQLIVPDRQGHGRSASTSRADDAQADGEQIAALLGKGAHLVGHSFGACVALAAAAMRPCAVLSLTLIEPGMQSLAMRLLAMRWPASGTGCGLSFNHRIIFLIWFPTISILRLQNSWRKAMRRGLPDFVEKFYNWFRDVLASALTSRL